MDYDRSIKRPTREYPLVGLWEESVWEGQTDCQEAQKCWVTRSGTNIGLLSHRRGVLWFTGALPQPGQSEKEFIIVLS